MNVQFVLTCVLSFSLTSAVGLYSSSVQSQPAANSAVSAVSTQSGTIEGVTDGAVVSFKGIPYAAPPTGDLRWREPHPAPSWTGVRKAGKYGNSCIQNAEIAGDVSHGDAGPLSEDCLYLNVWAPTLASSPKLPVMVWIHGGAFVIGTAGVPMTDGGPLASKGAVVVTLNYRLGQLGFFVHPALEKETPGGPANFGLLDQIAALKWVKQNIAKFGGDPNNVTIFGESAGAKSVLALFASPLARGLFQKGIVQSTYAIPEMSRSNALEMGAKVSDAIGLHGKNATAAALRAVPAEKFGRLKGQGLSTSPVAISGDKVLPRSIADIFASGEEARLPLIIGNTSDDSSVASAFGVNPADVLKNIRGAGFATKVLYPKVRDENERARQATRDLIFTMPVRSIADRHARLAPVWRYYFDYTAVKLRDKFPSGVPHGGEILYVMNTGDIYDATKQVFTDEDRTFSRTISNYWFQFARVGVPSASGAPAWPAHRPRADRTIIFGETIWIEKNFMKARLNIMIGLTKVAGKLVNRK